MARGVNSGKRGTRYWAPVSGSTFSTQPSGVTIDAATGVYLGSGQSLSANGTALSVTELAYVNGLANVDEGTNER